MEYYEGLTLLKCIDRKTNEQKSTEHYGRICNLNYIFGGSCRIAFCNEYILTSWATKSVSYYENESEKIMILTTLNSEYYFRVYFK